MSDHIGEERLHAWAVDALPDADHAEVETHLALCRECAREGESVRALVRELSALPAGIAPRRDLLPEINDRIDLTERSPAPGMGPAVLRRAAAVLLVVAGTALAGTLLIDSPQRPLTPSPEAQAFAQTRAEYARATAELEAMLIEQRATLSAEAASAVEQSLAAIDAALVEAAAALEKEPDNTLLSELVLDGWARKLDVLRRAAEPTAP